MSSDSSVSDYCRLCKISFKVKFGSSVGKQGYSSSENLFRPSKRKECFGVVLAEICKEVGLPLVQDSRQYSDRVCNPCGRKIRNLGQLYQLIRPAITSTESTPVKSSKRTLDTPQHCCHIVSNSCYIVPTLPRCVAVKIVVANRPV